MDKYIDTARRIHKVLLEFSDLVEVVSIDECFVDITHLVKDVSDAKNVCLDIKRRIKEETGLLCSIGVGPNKMLAKLGSKMQKPDGLVELHAADVPEKIWPLPLEKLQGVGIGPRLCERLNRLGIRTAGDLARTDARRMVAHFGIYGHTLRDIGMGLGSEHVRGYFEHDQAKSVGHSYTLPRDTTDMTIVKAYLRTLSERVGVRMREANLVGHTVSCYLRFGDFSGIGRQRALKTGISQGAQIYTAACAILKEFLPLRQPVRLVGVTMSETVLDGGQQLLLEGMRKQETFVQAVDQINKKYGEFTVKPMAAMVSENFGNDKKVGAFGKTFMGGPPKDYLGGLLRPKIFL
jgi:DNA polymerase-4